MQVFVPLALPWAIGSDNYFDYVKNPVLHGIFYLYPIIDVK